MSTGDAHAIWIGVDIAKQAIVAAIASGDSRNHAAFPTRAFERTAEGAASLLAWARAMAPGAPVRTVLEATGRYSAEFAAWLAAQDGECAPAIVDPRRAYHFAKSLGARNKTDQGDARMLARYGAERRPAPLVLPAPEWARLRELLRSRQSLVEQRVATEAARSEAVDPAVRRAFDRVVAVLIEQIAEIGRAAAALVAGSESLRADTARLRTIYGVAELTASTVLAELGDLRRFRTGRQLAAFAGLTPRRGESGTSVRRWSPITKCGTTHVRRVLFTSAMVAIRGKNHLADRYREMKARGAPRGSPSSSLREGCYWRCAPCSRPGRTGSPMSRPTGTQLEKQRKETLARQTHHLGG